MSDLARFDEPEGLPLPRVWRTSGLVSISVSMRSVLTAAGAMALTRTRSRAYWRAVDLVSASTADLALV